MTEFLNQHSQIIERYNSSSDEALLAGMKTSGCGSRSIKNSDSTTESWRENIDEYVEKIPTITIRNRKKWSDED